MSPSDFSGYFSALSTAHDSEQYYSLARGEDLMPIHSHAMNLIVGRDLRRNVSYSAAWRSNSRLKAIACSISTPTQDRSL